MGWRDSLSAFFSRSAARGPGTYEPPPHSAPLVVPALGDAFDLHIVVHLRWSCDTLDDADVKSWALDRRDGTLYILGRQISDMARSLDPLQPARAQATINGSEVIKRSVCYSDNGHLLKCRPLAQVWMDPRLRDQLLPFESQRVELGQQHRTGLLRVQHMQDRAERWLQAFQQLEHFDQLGKDERQFLLQHAAALVDEQFAKVMGAIAVDRRVQYDSFIDILSRTGREHERMGLFEFATAYDKALQTFCRQMGVNPASFLLSDFGDAPPSNNGTPSAELVP